MSVYLDFVLTLATQQGFPAAKAPAFFLGTGPITHAYKNAVAKVIAGATARGIPAYPVAYTTPVDRCGHPPYNSHVLMYQQARPVIAAALGWQ